MGTATIQSTTPRTVGFVGISTFLHVATALSILLFADSIVKKPEPQITEVQILSTPPPPTAGLPQTHAAESTTSPVVPAVASVAKTKIPVAKHVAARAPKVIVAKATASSHARPPATPPVESPNFDAAADLGDIPVVVEPKLDESIVDEDLNKVNQTASKELADETNNLEKQAHQEISSLASENDEKIAALEQENRKESERLATLAKKNHEENVKGIAQLLAAENAKKAAAGGAGGSVRGIEDLRQMPGNKRPEYDQDDRFNRRQGEVVFLAYVTRSGNLTNFQLIKGSGHRTLDYKTLAALKNWKFYPGQEGTVEIPFLWDLKGGPQEIPSGLRTKISQQEQRTTDLRNQ